MKPSGYPFVDGDAARSRQLGGVATAVLFSLAAVMFPALLGSQKVDAQSASAAPPYTAPRTPDGKPDLQGVWQVLNTAAWDIQDHSARLGVPAGQGVVDGNDIPYQPWALAKKKENFDARLTADPETKCYNPGVPRLTYMPFPFEIIQFSEYVVIAYEYIHSTRIIRTDGSAHADAPDFWMGDSRGRWEGETLVVDVNHFNDQTWFDRAGNFHSDALHVVERYTRTGTDHLQYEVTVDDPKVFTRPWKMSMPVYRRLEKNVAILEYECYSYAYDADVRFFLKDGQR